MIRSGSPRAALLLLLVLWTLLPAREVSAQAPMRRVMVFFEVAEDAGLSDAQRRFLRETLFSSLSDEDPETRYVPAADTPDRVSMSRQAREAGCDAWLHVWITGGGTVSLEVVSSYTQEPLFSEELDLDSGAEPRRLALRLWGPSARRIAALDFSIERERSVLIRGAPGTEISGLTTGPITMTGEELRVALEYPAVHTMEAFSTRHYAERVRFFVGEEGAEVSLKQDRRSRLLLSAYAQEAAYPGLEVSYLIVPPRLFLRAAAHTYSTGLVPFAAERDPDDSAEHRRLIVSQPLTRFRFLAGAYWNDTRGRFHFYSALGPMIRLLHAEAYTGIEPIAPWGIELANGFELHPQRKLRFFFEHSPTFVIVTEPELIWEAFSAIGGPEPIFAPGDGAYLDILSFRVGLRYQW